MKPASSCRQMLLVACVLVASTMLFVGCSPKAPTGVRVKRDNGYPTISWSASEGSTRYLVYRKIVRERGDFVQLTGGSTDGNYFVDSTLSNDTTLRSGDTIYYAVCAVNSNNKFSEKTVASQTFVVHGQVSDPIEENGRTSDRPILPLDTSSQKEPGIAKSKHGTKEAKPAPRPKLTDLPSVSPSPPTNLQADASANGVTLRWINNAVGSTSFRIERRTLNDNWAQIASPSATETTFDDNGVTPNTMYWYRMRVVTPQRLSAYSDSVSVTTPTGPMAPSHLRAVATSPYRVELRWTYNSTDAQRFEIERSDGDGFSRIDRVQADTTKYVDTSVTAAMSYNYRVRVITPNGLSPYSNVAEVDTPQDPVIAALLAGPWKFQWGPGWNGDLTFTWSNGQLEGTHDYVFGNMNPGCPHRELRKIMVQGDTVKFEEWNPSRHPLCFGTQAGQKILAITLLMDANHRRLDGNCILQAAFGGGTFAYTANR